MIVNVASACHGVEKLTTKENGSIEKNTVNLSPGMTMTKVRYVVPTHSGPNYVNIHFEDNSVIMNVLRVCLKYDERQNQEILNHMIPPQEKENVLSKSRGVPGQPVKRRGCCGRRR